MNENRKRSASLIVNNDSCNTSDDDDYYDDDFDDYLRMTKDELISALRKRDDRISLLERQCKRAKTTTTTTKISSLSASSATPPPPPPPPTISPEKIQQKVDQLRKLAYKGIKSQIKWRPSCREGTARFAYTGMCDEATFRGFFGLTKAKDKTKGGKVDCERFQDDMVTNRVVGKIRYGYLCLKGNVNVTYNKTTCEIKITGGFGL